MLACHASLPLQAQPDSLLLRDYQLVKQADPWLSGQNAAALKRYSSADIAWAELLLNGGGGRLTPHDGSPSVLQVGAAAEAFQRLSSRTVVFGAISYDNWTGRDMTGSAFIPALPATGGFPVAISRRPFDIVEATQDNSGRKHRDTYQLAGAFSHTVADGFAIGIRLDYTAANYAKYKDLRHQNKLMDLTASAGIYADLLPWLSAGGNYTYHRQTESVSFSVNGKSEQVYKSLIDYGAFMGQVEQFGNEGYTDKSREMPLFEDSHGGSLQLELHPWLAWSLYGSMTMSHGTGYYGRRSPYTITYTNHTRDISRLHTRLSYAPLQCASRFCLDVLYSSEQLENNAETYRGLTNTSGATYYEYYDPTETGRKHWRDLDIAYTMHLGIRGEQPTWTARAVYHHQQRDITAYLFPYYRWQQLTTNSLSASLTRHVIMPQGIFSVTVSGGFQQGSGDPYTDGTLLSPGGKQTPPATMEAFLWQDYQYLTAAQYAIGMQLQYAFLFPGTRLKTHVRAAFDHRKANEVYNDYCGRDYTTGTLAVGCTF